MNKNKKKIKKIIYLLLLGIFCVGIQNSPFVYGDEKIQSIHLSEKLNQFSEDYERQKSVDPIHISCPDDWKNYDFITGSGAVNDPYIIENVEIIGPELNIEENETTLVATGIFITDSSSSYIIRNCIIAECGNGIYIDDLQGLYPKEISNNQIENCIRGISFVGDNMKIINNNISECRALPEDRIKLIERDSYMREYGGTKNIRKYCEWGTSWIFC
ncbi:MAG: hypothetical protein K9W44_04720 [Candidatus Lokiarchaeota archaeon]|nr:hypothetical protein [Candidatus Harpocratesius repetitus]